MTSSTAAPLLPWANVRSPQAQEVVPPLAELALDALAANPEGLVDLRCTAEHLVIGLLERIVKSGRFNYRVACLFRDAGHPRVTEYIQGLALLDAMPTHNSIACRGRLW
mmetsp:Transcript_14858/g.32214  ORF Transcript_14858/g.32214 Transcript_14858/m.32214 type:complete len:109 (-) Transcript_14858:613-939(-)